MNYRNEGLREIQGFAKEFPDYSLGEILYASLRLAGVKNTKDLLQKTDEEIYTAINKASEVEQDTPIENETV